MNVRIRAPKADRIGAIIFFFFTVFGYIYSLYIDEGEVLLIFLGVFCVGYAFGVEILCTKDGVEKKLFGRTMYSFEWSECRFIGIYIPIYKCTANEKLFMCAIVPKHTIIKFAKWSWHYWKPKEEISISYHWVGDENYRKILELCGGERSFQESDMN